MGYKLLEKINRLFPLPVHPFNLQNDGVTTYAKWQYEKGADTIKFYLDSPVVSSSADMFSGKSVLDIGCGACGKTMFYGKMGAEHITGMDIVPEYEKEAYDLAKELGLSDKFTFVLGDAAKTDFRDESFDVIIMNDAMEHVAEPEKVLAEAYRILIKGGRLYVNFPPYNHPFGAHLSDVIGIPWVHCFFSEKTLIAAYKDLVSDKPDGDARIHFRISKDENGKEYFSYINKMTIKRFKKIKANSPFNVIYYAEIPLRGFLTPLARLPFFKEFFVKMAVCIFEK